MIYPLHQNYEEIKGIVNRHEQLRKYSCVQSAVEIVLKLYGVIGEGIYPEQAWENLDKGGFEAYTRIGFRKYYGTTVKFIEEKYDSNLWVDWRQDAWVRGVALLANGIYPIFSFVNKLGFHTYIGIPDKTDPMQFTTKPVLGPCEADIQSRYGVWQHQTKTEILIVRIDYPIGRKRKEDVTPF